MYIYVRTYTYIKKYIVYYVYTLHIPGTRDTCSERVESAGSHFLKNIADIPINIINQCNGRSLPAASTSRCPYIAETFRGPPSVSESKKKLASRKEKLQASPTKKWVCSRKTMLFHTAKERRYVDQRFNVDTHV